MKMNRVLIVDDIEEARYLLRALLHGNGYEVVTAVNGANALELARQDPPDLIISDILMPAMDGFTLCREWKKDERLKRIPFVFYTATYTDERDRRFALSLGAERFIIKPEEPLAFLEIIRETVRQAEETAAPQTEPAARTPEPEEVVYLKQYNEALIRKLEAKMEQLEQANRELERDIAARVILEKSLRQAQKMEALGTLAGGIAHDFNNILMAIIGNAEMACADVPEGSRARDRLDQVLKSGLRAKELVRHILACSRQTEVERNPVQVAPVVKEVLNLLRPSLPATIEILPEISISPGKGVILGDPSQIHQVLMNLCTNAAHAMRAEGGVLSIGLSEVDASLVCGHLGMKAGRYVMLTVEDTGHGMDPDIAEHIFDPYFTTKGVGEGTGLGLWVVQGIVKNHGGSICVHSEPGRGTTFHVFFETIAREAASQTGRSEAFPRGSERILFVDDEEVLVDVGKEMLESLGYDVTAKTSASDALEAFRAEPGAFDLVVTDMTMPALTGDKFAERLLDVRKDIPIILCTGFSELVDERRAKELGIRQFVMKPFTLATLAEAVRKALEQK